MADGVDPQDLGNELLMQEPSHLHATRFETPQHGGADALRNHTDRMTALEAEYLRHHPERHVDPNRTREGSRLR
jgi:hypothetical protein